MNIQAEGSCAILLSCMNHFYKAHMLTFLIVGITLFPGASDSTPAMSAKELKAALVKQ